MSGLVNVKDYQGLHNSAQELLGIQEHSEHAAQVLEAQLMALQGEASAELGISETMLAEAVVKEQMALAELLEAQVELTHAEAEMAEAAASGNPFAIAMASERLAEAGARVAEAMQKYQEAVAHRERMERRVELCKEALARAEALLNDVQTTCQSSLSKMRECSGKGNETLENAYNTLVNYYALTSAAQRAEYEKWTKPNTKEEEKGNPVKPPAIIDRLNPSKEVMKALLAELVATDSRFAEMVKRLQEQAINGERDRAELTIRRNVSGRLAEEIVKRAFSPYGDVSTQQVEYLDEGYTKIDLMVTNLKTRVILSHGLSAPEGGSIAIEVKTGDKRYLQSQIDHIKKQIKGHAECDASCVLVSRDIHTMTESGEQGMRDIINENGSRVLAMMPLKEELDDVCMEFILPKVEGES